jgi:uncharacterized protein
VTDGSRRILVDILHPNQAHFFRPLIEQWRGRGDVVRITTRDKDITHELLDAFGFEYTRLSKQQRGLRMALELVQRWVRMFRLMRRFRPEIAMSVTGITTALPARLLRIPNIAFTDTETATLSNRIAFPFATRILTPEWFTIDFGEKHHRYRGFHEWSYLNPVEFSLDPAILRSSGVDPDQPYAVVRFVRWDAVHDRGEQGLSPADAATLVRELAKKMSVYVSSEALPPDEIKPYLINMPVEQMHHLLAGAALVVGESPSMATEAALLGVPSVLISSWAGACGNMIELERRRLIQVHQLGGPAVGAALAVADRPLDGPSVSLDRDELVAGLDDLPGLLNRYLSELSVDRPAQE